MVIDTAKIGRLLISGLWTEIVVGSLKIEPYSFKPEVDVGREGYTASFKLPDGGLVAARLSMVQAFATPAGP